MTDQTISDIDNARTVETFLYALQDEDFDVAEKTLSEHLAWENVGFPTIHGSRRAMKLFRSMQGKARFEVKIHRIATEGSSVLTERTDALIFGPLRVQFWVCGVFELHAGRITLWRDYFDVLDFTKATARALVAAVFPALRPTF
jgi:limonene-1,2-epoxide hydrolase